MAELTRKAQIAAGADLAPLTPGEQLVKTLASGGSGGGGGGVLRVNVTKGSDNEFSADKTFDEISTAFDSGMNVVLIWEMEPDYFGHYHLTAHDYGTSKLFVFEHTYVFFDGVSQSYSTATEFFAINEDNHVNYVKTEA